MKRKINVVVGGCRNLNLTFGDRQGQPFFAISPSVGSGFGISFSGGFTFGNYKGKDNTLLPQSFTGGFIYQNGGAGLLGFTFTQDAKRRNRTPEFGNRWQTQSINLNIGSKTIFVGSAGAGITFIF